MAVEEFNKLPHFEQEELVKDKAILWQTPGHYGEYLIHYYGLFDFAVEVYVFKETGNISRFKAIARTQASTDRMEN